MLSPRITLGRSPENDISIPDNRCSRRQALIEIGPNGLVLRNLSDTRKPQVNGQDVQQAFLANGTQIQLGETLIAIQIKDINQQANIGLAPNEPQSSVAVDPYNPASPKKNKTVFYLIVVLILGALALLLSEDSSNTNKKINLRTLEAQEEETQQSAENRQKLEEARARANKQTPQYIKAKAAYLKGFREYQSENYKRAISEFQTALSLYPNLEIAQEYLGLSQSKFDKKIQDNMFEARQFFERKQYKRAMSSYKNVMILINRPRDPTYREAQAKFEECATLLKGAL